MKTRLAMFLLTLAVALPALAYDETLTIRPAQPSSDDLIEVTVAGDWKDSCVPHFSRVERSGSTIRLIFSVPTGDSCLSVITPWSERVTIGPFEEGTIRLEAFSETAQDERTLLAVREITVTNSVEPSPANFEMFLLPVMFEGAGGHGSQWTTELVLFNDSETPIEPWQWVVLCAPGEPCFDSIPPRTPLVLGPRQLLPWVHGYLLAVPRDRAGDLHASLRIRDLSRGTETWGTEIPVIRENDLPGKIVLLNVPLDDRFRRTLRIYDVGALDGGVVSMRWFRMDTGEEVGSAREVVLRTSARCAVAPCWLPDPAGAAIPLDGPFPPVVGGNDRLRIEITPVTRNLRLWAMVTVTNNETQHVTTITPR